MWPKSRGPGREVDPRPSSRLLRRVAGLQTRDQASRVSGNRPRGRPTPPESSVETQHGAGIDVRAPAQLDVGVQSIPQVLSLLPLQLEELGLERLEAPGAGRLIHWLREALHNLGGLSQQPTGQRLRR